MRIKIAGISVQLNNRYDHIERVAQNFVTDLSPDVTVEVSQKEIDAVRRDYPNDTPDGYIEAVELYRKISDKLYLFDAFLMHGVAIYYDG